MPLIEALERLAILRREGVLTEEEFTLAKRRLISPPGAVDSTQASIPTQSSQTSSTASATTGSKVDPLSEVPSETAFANSPVQVRPSPATTALENNPEALIGFLIGLLSVILYFVGIIPVVAVLFSLIGLNTFDDTRHKNKWMAVVGLTLGVTYCLVSLNYYGHL